MCIRDSVRGQDHITTGVDRVIIIPIPTVIGPTTEGTSTTRLGSIMTKTPDQITMETLPTTTTVGIKITPGQIIIKEIIIIIDRTTITTGRIIVTITTIIITDRTTETTVVIIIEEYTTLMPVEAVIVDHTTRVAGATTVITAGATAMVKSTNRGITPTEATVVKIIGGDKEMKKFITTEMDLSLIHI